MTALNSDVLLLSKSWQPIKVVSAKRALTLLFKGIAEAVDMTDQAYSQYNFESWLDVSEYREQFEPDQWNWIQAVRMKILVPTIVRLVDYDSFRRKKVRFSRRNIYARDKYTCQYCGNKFRTEDLNLDHVIPRSRGGKTVWNNIVCSCVSCNRRKDDRTPKEAKMPLLSQPHEPAAGSIVDVPVIRHKSWQAFLDESYWNVELED